jgi:gliding motility-associated-like protein
MNLHHVLCRASLVLGLAAAQPMQGQTLISGIINSYASVSAVSGSTLSVSDISGFSPGDRVVVLQMKGASFSTAVSAEYGSIVDYGTAGHYEYALIDAVSAGQITLERPLCKAFDPAGLMQVVSVPDYSDAEVVAPGLTCPAWNGSTGGILALRVSGSLILSAGISVSERGFRGGAFCDNFFDCADFRWISSFTTTPFGATCVGGEKGEGIGIAFPDGRASRARLTNGGGGSSASNCGGGGGGNGGSGGLGGFPWSGCGALPVQGIPGQALDYEPDRVFAGGGGGGGYRDNGQPVTPGGRGGGIALIEAGVLDARGQTIAARGEALLLTSLDEGAGGGGAGGSLVLRIGSLISELSLDVRGGRGGDTQNSLFAPECHGPGGGGGGGYIATNLPVWPAMPMVSTLLDGGAPGQILHTTGECGFPSSHGAAAGQPGQLRFDLPDEVGAASLDLGPDSSACQGSEVLLNAGSGFASYLWSDGSSDSVLLVLEPGTYFVEVEGECGSASDTVTISFEPLPAPDLGPDLSLCEGELLTLDAGPEFSSYLWSDGSTNPQLSVALPGLYTVLVSGENGCAGSDSLRVSGPFALPQPDLGPDLALCEGQELLLDAGAGFAAYAWNTGNTLQFQAAAEPGVYRVTVTDANGCSGSDSLSVLLREVEACQSTLTFPNAFSPNGDGLNDVFRPVAGGAGPDQYSLQIFNRWGELVFLSSDWREGWDGTYQGKPAELGVYVWTAHLTLLREGFPVPVKRSGTLTLVR